MKEARKPVRGRLRPSRTRVVMAAAALLFCGLLYWWREAAAPAVAAGPARVAATVPVEVAAAKRADVPVYLQGLGTVQAYYTVKVTPRVDGQLQRIGFTEGQVVDKGAFLARIDPRPYRAALEQAIAARDKDAAQLANAERDLRRYERLAPQNLTSRQTLDTQRAQVAELKAQIEADRAAIDSARTELDYTTITAPIRGRTGIRLVDPGNIVHATDTTGIVVITQMKPISVLFTLPEESLAAVETALAKGPVGVAVLSRDGGAVLDRGHLALIDNQIDPSTGTIRIKATFPNPRDALWPGQYVKARTRVGTERDVLTVPSDAILRGPDGTFVYQIGPDATVKAQPVVTGVQDGASVVVTSGLEDGARVVTSNQFRLQPGSRVEVIAGPRAGAS